MEKIQEIFQDFWAKLVLLIPACFLNITDREQIMLVALLGILTVDCVLGAMKAYYVDCSFKWGLLSKKFSKKFLLYFLTLMASFLISRAYEAMEWWLYVIGTLLVFSEFSSLLSKARALGLPIRSDLLTVLNQRIDQAIKSALGLPPTEQCSLEKGDPDAKKDSNSNV